MADEDGEVLDGKELVDDDEEDNSAAAMAITAPVIVWIVEESGRGLNLVEVERVVAGHRAVQPRFQETRPSGKKPIVADDEFRCTLAGGGRARRCLADDRVYSVQ